MFWTDDSIQTSFSMMEVMIAVGLFLLATLYYLIRTRAARKQMGVNGGSFIRNFVKILAIPLAFAVIAILVDEHKIAVMLYGEENVVKSDYVVKENDADKVAVISKPSGGNLYKWDGLYLRQPSGKIIIRYEENRFMTAVGKPIIKWEDQYFKSISGKNLFKFEGGVLSKVSGKNLYKFELNQVAEISGENILTIDNPYDLPREVVMFAVLHYTKRL